ncbi:MAG TPA: hypothetical protein VF477_09030 [Mycobacterium sp.]
MAAILTLGGGTAANAAVASPPADDVSVADSNEAAIDATLATIDDPAQQASVRAWMEESTADGSEIITAQAGDCRSSGSEGAARRAYPSGCGLYVLILCNGQKITNDTLTSCVSGPYQFLTHQMRVTGYHGVFGTPNEVTGVRTYNYGGGSSQSQQLSWTCPNHNKTSFRAISLGVMAKNGQEYTTPTVYDTFDQGNIDCGW